MLDDAQRLVNAGADMLLLECIPAELGRQITEAVPVPVIGIGAGPDTDGQILVLYDILDITSGRKPRFVRNFMASQGGTQAACGAYVEAVKNRGYPAPEHCF
jgi:3-methyl-2-oxobutanoate hydroxymethyltransferase